MIRTRAIDALRAIPAAMALHEFGSRVNGSPDAWSDIDLQVITGDVSAAVAGRGSPFVEIAPVLVEWEIQQTPTEWAATVLFAGASPFCHLDIGFSSPDSFAERSTIGNARLVWSREPAPDGGQRSPVWYAPKAGSVEHAVIGELLGVVRYIKARRRKQDLLCWKFFSALANRVLEAAYLARMDRSRGFRKPLSSHEHIQLSHVLPQDERRRLASMVMAGNDTEMDRSVILLGTELTILGSSLEDVSSTYGAVTMALLRWIEHALRDQEFNDAL